jgi:ABC-type multidrug transport system fused ATPase/permease subunit
MCIIPQDPVLFSGSVRLNVDPFSDFTDEECWSALHKVRLSVLVKSLPGELHAHVQEGGSNYSVGERQLMCMARALLLQPRVLILDEATASVDHDTDEFIQQTVREAFKGATLISIAHRLNTVMDCDRIMVMSDGKVAEFDSPKTLLLDPGSMFSALVRSTGKANSQHLRAAVEQQGWGGGLAEPKADNAAVVLQIR